MGSLIAKPVVNDRYWIVTDGSNKVGNVIADENGYSVMINGIIQHRENTADIMREYSIDFENRVSSEIVHKPSMPDWPTTGTAYNSLLDIKRKLHLYTKTSDSKCYYAAGWYNMKIADKWETVFCPKYIFIQRYPWTGPYHSQVEATTALCSGAVINTT